MPSPTSNITVGKSWPRPTTPPEPPLQPKWEGEFCSHQDWINFASKRLTVARDSNGYPLKAICVDTLGRRCANGGDFKRAHDEGTFPVRYFFEMEISGAPTPPDLQALLGYLRNAQITLDCSTKREANRLLTEAIRRTERLIERLAPPADQELT